MFFKIRYPADREIRQKCELTCRLLDAPPCNNIEINHHSTPKIEAVGEGND